MKFFQISLISLFFLNVQELCSQSLKDPVRQFVRQELPKWKLLPADFEDAIVLDDFESGGFHYVYFQQTFRGVAVFNGILNVVEPPSGVKRISGVRFVPNLAKRVEAQSVKIDAVQALSSALTHLGIPWSGSPVLISSVNGKGSKRLYQKVEFEKQGSVEENIPAELVWTVLEERIELSWNIRIKLKNDWWELRVSALNGEVLEKNNWVSHCSFDVPAGSMQLSTPELCDGNEMQAMNDYTVFDIPLMSPVSGARTTVNSPWLKAGANNNATSLKWHNDGSNSYTNTRGNNVYAKEDINADNEASIGYSPNVAGLDFSFPFTVGATATLNRDAAITNLFYWNNICHDVLYQYGFDEASGNFQRNNQGRGGSGNDFVYADAMDGSGTNNANFSVPPDGTAPRMQMFLWNAAGATSLFKVNSPLALAGDYVASAAVFNPPTPASVTGNLVISNPSDGCSSFSNQAAVNGKIAVIDRGNCTFVTKVKNAQNAGAIGVVIVNNVSGAPPSMAGTDASIQILSCMISNTNGAQIKNGMQSGTVNGTIQQGQSGSAPLDASFDNGVIVHEYGHGVSNRLTGGRSTTSCLSNAEQMGEGWSDYFALMLCTDWSTAQANDPRGIGNYVLGETLTGTGIRQYPYSYDMAISPYNYNFARNNPEVHELGSAWASMLWDMTWNIIAITPASTDIYHGEGGNNIALRLVMEGLKLQPCSPGFVDGRDAILLADEMLYNSRYKCAIWNAFARRGLGISASQGSRNSASDGTQAFDAPKDISLSITASKPEIAPGDTIEFTLSTVCECSGNSQLQLSAELSPKLDFIESQGSYNETARTVSYSPFDLLIGGEREERIKTVVRGDFTQPILQFLDDAENGPSKWRSEVLSGSTTSSFAIGNIQAHSGTKSWYIFATTLATQTALVLNQPITLMANSWLKFWHSHKIEDNYDGGVVEISTNNGATWQDLGSRMVNNGYNGVIDITDNSLQGRPVFTGELGIRQTSVDLSDFSGQDVLVRFRYGSDTQNGALPTATGWFIDDIQFTSEDTCVLVEARVSNSFNSITASVCLGVIPIEPVITAQTPLPVQDWGVFPNPARDKVCLRLPNEHSIASVRLMTITGQELRSARLSAKQGDFYLDLQDYPPAPYLIEIESTETRKVFKVVKL